MIFYTEDPYKGLNTKNLMEGFHYSFTQYPRFQYPQLEMCLDTFLFNGRNQSKDTFYIIPAYVE
jgi:hypothetical protein